MLKRSLAASLAFAALASSSAFAATSTINNFTVSVAITAGCTISATNINFGSLQGNVLLATAQTSTVGQGGLFTYQCTTGGAAPVLTASTGGQPSGGVARMKGITSALDLIPYSLTMPTIAAFTGAAQTAQITATIPIMATAPAVDSYSDTVTLTLTY